MPRIKGQSDGIRKRGAQHPEHTISLAGKKETGDAEKVFLRREEPKSEPAIVKRDTSFISPIKKEEAIPREIFPEMTSKPTVRESSPPERTKSVQVSKSEEATRAPVEEIKEPIIGEDKVSSWFFRKKPGAPKAQDDFYTSAGLSEEEQEEKKKRQSLFRGILVGGGSLFIILILLSTVFARVTVSVNPKIETVEIQDVTVVFDTTVASSLPKQKILPAAKLEFSKTVLQEFEATGKKTADFKARGTVKIYNAFNSSPQPLVSKTRFLSGNGVLYRLLASITIPAAKIESGKVVPQFVEAELVADLPGDRGNISGEVKLVIPGFQGTPKYSGFYAIAPSGFSGGAEGERIVVTKEDRTRASEEVTKQVYAELEKESSVKVPPDFTVVDALREIEIVKVDVPPADTAVDRFTASTDAVLRLIVFRQEDVVSFLRGLVTGQDQTREIVPDSIELTYTARSIDFVKGRAEVVIRGSIQTRAVISESDIVNAIKGRSASEVKEFLEARTDVASSDVSFFPPWLLGVPGSAEKVRIRYE
ncbi:MAG: hypothetical protein A2131_02765 [Candidatus Sungbacteria bacterium GWC2_49_10]|uniref:Baseplate protein J-like domain-containing protein n=2 Tax=Parcubacteria group TaxID=1794811 RepID=A0A0G1WR77_9BACT|nr:MAG: hypothetical protein UY61_C0008G0010 [Candidatus Adlerbacteria bacterium GW2011_GWC1_50_9]OGZ94675.1 MAG: hypothetical protein A2131_02765 [Candidatus Sungbacteria bacterium GWC2_49_10]